MTSTQTAPLKPSQILRRAAVRLHGHWMTTQAFGLPQSGKKKIDCCPLGAITIARMGREPVGDERNEWSDTSANRNKPCNPYLKDATEILAVAEILHRRREAEGKDRQEWRNAPETIYLWNDNEGTEESAIELLLEAADYIESTERDVPRDLVLSFQKTNERTVTTKWYSVDGLTETMPAQYGFNVVQIRPTTVRITLTDGTPELIAVTGHSYTKAGLLSERVLEANGIFFSTREQWPSWLEKLVSQALAGELD